MLLDVDALAQVSQMVHEIVAAKAQLGRDGMVMPNSYDAAKSTVDVMLCDTAVVFPDDPGPLNPQVESGVPLATTHLDDGYGPFGGELVHLVPIQSGYTAYLYRTPDGSDAPGVPTGERWIQIRNLAGTVISSDKRTLDGSTPGDGLGGVNQLVGGYMKKFTLGGHAITADDTVKILSMVSANGLSHALNDASGQIVHAAGTVTQTLDKEAVKLTHAAGPTVYALLDGNGNAISHVAGSIGLGAIASTLAAARAAIAKNDMTTFEGSMFTQRLTDIKNGITALLAAMQASGVPSLPTAAAAFAQLATLAHIPIPNGSSIVKIAP